MSAFVDVVEWVLEQAAVALGDDAPAEEYRWWIWNNDPNRVDWDHCCDGGQLTISVGDITRAVGPRAAGPPSCQSGWDIPMTIQMLGCGPKMKKDGSVPPAVLIANHAARLDEASTLLCHLLTVFGGANQYEATINRLSTVDEPPCRAVRVALTVHLL